MLMPMEKTFNAAEAEARIARCWHPYHRALRDLVESTHAQFGQAVLIDCHSMPHEAIEHHSRPGRPAPRQAILNRNDLFPAASHPHTPARLPAVLRVIARSVGAPHGIAAGQAWECETRADLGQYQRAKTGDHQQRWPTQLAGFTGAMGHTETGNRRRRHSG